MQLVIVAPTGILCRTTIDSISLPGEAGAFTVLPRHAPIIARLAAGTVRYEEQGKTEPAIEDLIKLADFFEVSIDVLLGHNQPSENVSSDAVDELVFQIMKKLSEKDKIRALGYVQALAQQDYPY